MIVPALAVYLIVLACPVYAMKIERKYKRLTKETSTRNSTQLALVPKRSKIECAMACSDNDKCDSFHFDRRTKACSMIRGCTNCPPGSVYFDENLCPNGLGYTYVQQFNLCFRMEGDTGKILPQTKAICESEYAHLILIENQEVDQFLTNEIFKRGLNASTGHLFIDGSDEEQENIWKNYGGDVMTYTNLHDEEPNGGTNQNCLSMDKARNYQWSDAGCDDMGKTGGYICQIDIC